MYDALKDKTALYIEDEIDVLENISTLLSNFFKEFLKAPTAEEGYEIFQNNSIDVLLVDIELPKMNGIELIKKIRKTHKNLPIVVISAYTKTDYLLESVELKLDKYIVKPLTSRKIHQLLQTLNSDFLDSNLLTLDKDIYIDRENYLLKAKAKDIKLNKKELGFLVTLAKKKMITYDEVYELWEDDVPSSNAVRSFVKILRKKLPTGFIKNKSSIGYYIERSFL